MDRDREPKEGPKAPESRAGQRRGPSGGDLAGIGMQFGLTILAFVFGGVWLDGRLHTSPWFTLGCTFVGAAGGGYSMYRRTMAADRRDERGDR